MKTNNNIKGISFAIASSIGFGIMPIFVKDALNNGLDIYNIIFLRFTVAAITLFTLIRGKKISLKISKPQFLEILLLSIVGYLLTTYFLFLSYTYIPTGLATTLHFTYAAFVALIMIIIFKEKFNFIKGTAIFLSLVGICLLVFDTSFEVDLIGVTLATLTGLTYAIYVVGISKSKANSLNSVVFVFYITLISGTLLGLNGLVTNKINIPLNFHNFMDIAGLTLFSTVLASILLFKAIRIIGATHSAILSTLEPLVCIFFGIILLEEEINLYIILGALLIIASVIMISIKKEPTPKVRLRKALK